MPVDTSIYGILQPQPSPLQTMGAAAQTMSAINQNRLFQQQFKANLAASAAAKGAVDPQTGMIDTAKYSNALANSDAAYQLPDFLQRAQQMQQTQLGIQKEKLDLASKHLSVMNDGIASLLSQPDITPQQVIGKMGELINTGALDTQTATAALANMPQNPAELRPWLTQHMIQNLDSQAKVQALYGQIQAADTGPNIQLYRASPIGGVSPVGVIQKGLSPEVATTPTQIGTTPQNQPIMGTREQFINQAQGQQQTTVAPSGGAPQGMPSGQPQGSQQTPQQGIVTGVPMGAAAAADETARGSAKAWNDLRADVGGTASRIYQLGQALRGLQGSPTGPGTETMNNIKSFISAQSPDVLKRMGLNPDVDKIKSYDEANKYLTAFAAAQAGALGQGTDSKLATALSANASTHISNLAAQDVVKANIGLERMKQAQASAFQASGQPPQNYSDWAIGWNKDTDPRAFVIDQMTPTERATMLKGMKPSEQKKFLDSVRMGLATGVLTLADIQASQNGAK